MAAVAHDSPRVEADHRALYRKEPDGFVGSGHFAPGIGEDGIGESEARCVPAVGFDAGRIDGEHRNAGLGEAIRVVPDAAQLEISPRRSVHHVKKEKDLLPTEFLEQVDLPIVPFQREVRRRLSKHRTSLAEKSSRKKEGSP